MSLVNLSLDSNRALTFRIGDTRFGIDVCNILAFSDEYSDIRSPTRATAGFIGYLDYRERLVKVFECATVLNRGRGREHFEALSKELKRFSHYHRDKLDSMARALEQEHPCDGVANPDSGEFGRWLSHINGIDTGLDTLAGKMSASHQEIMQLIARLTTMASQGQRADAVEALHFERPALLRKVDRLFTLLQDYLHTNVHPVVLHLTKDGLTPWFSLVLDEIDDIVEYDPDWIDTTSGAALSNEPVSGYVRNQQGENFMMLAIEQLYTELSGRVENSVASA